MFSIGVLKKIFLLYAERGSTGMEKDKNLKGLEMKMR